jgi:16S rRNA (adenine1518-N6/adenine1519-N6)-dimethyltransferase
MGNPLILTPLNIPKLLRDFDLHPDKRLGQNFLIDPIALQRVAEMALISKQDTVIEIGPGLGSLTRHLALLAQKVIAIEIDPDLILPLRQVVAPFQNVEIIQGDILTLQPDTFIPSTDFLVVANIPYYITSAILRHILTARSRPKRAVLTVQYEVAQRVCAEPGDLSLLALSVQVFGEPHIKARISAGAFYPTPKVDSAILRLDLFSEPLIPAPLLDTFFYLAQAGFSQKRKMLRNALSSGLNLRSNQVEEILLQIGIDPRRRAETLSIAEWGLLTRYFVDYLPEISLQKSSQTSHL